jgi:hypothetical protein
MSWSTREILFFGYDILRAWKKRNAEILSCFDIDKLQERMQAFADLELGAALMQELRDASNEARDADRVADTWMKAYNQTFITLWDRGVLTHSIVVDDIPDAAQAQLDAMAAEVDSYNQVEEVAEYVAPVAPIDPVTLCVQEFHELASSQFKAKYLNNQRNRPIYEAAIDRGLL